MKILRIIALGIIMCSCRDSTIEDIDSIEKDNSLINYYVEVKSFGEYDYLSFSFDYLRADQMGSIYRTVYLEPKDITLAYSQQNVISLGSSTIEPLPIKGYSIGASRFHVQKGDELMPLILNDFIYVESDLYIDKQATLDIIFEIDLNSSVLLDSAGMDWLIPKIDVKKK